MISKSTFCSLSTFRSFILMGFALLAVQAVLQAQPVISGYSPASGPGGTQVTITGSNFNANSTLNVVRFNGVKANVTQSSANSITCIVPANATYGPVTVTQGGLTGVSKLPFRTTFNAGTNTLTNTSFTEKLSIQAEGTTRPNLTADMDEDGWTDIVNMDYQTAKIRIYRNTTQGQTMSFGSPLLITTSPAAGFAKVGDMDGDGLLDLVTFNSSVSGLSVYRNTSTSGNLSFAAPFPVATGEIAYDGAVEDFNNDGKLDLVVLNYNAGTISVLRNTGSTGNLEFAAPVNIPVNTTPIAISTGDFDGDGFTDIVVGSSVNGGYAILKNTGNFTFQVTKVPFQTGFYYGCSADFNNDGKLDFAFTANYISFLFLNITPSGGPITFSTQSFTGGLIINCSDVTGEGAPDIVMDGTQPYYTAVLTNKGSGTPLLNSSVFFNFPFGSVGTAVGDFDNDGRPDMVKSVTNTSKIVVMGNGIRPFYLGDFFPTTGNRKTPITISGGDFNGVTGVKFGGVPAASFTIFNNSTIEAIPGFAASGDVEVIKGSEVIKKPGFTYQKLAMIESADPLVGYPGAKIFIRGKYLDQVIQVIFGGMAALSFQKQSDTLIIAIVDSGNTGSVIVRDNSGDEDSIPGFTFYPAPNINSITPLNAPPGTVVSILGNNLSDVTKVLFHETPGTNLTVINSSKLEVTTPTFASGGWVKVISPYGKDSLAGFYNGPLIISVTPSSGILKNSVVISGKGFENASSGNIVRFGTVQAKLLEFGLNALTVEVPPGTPSGYISVTSFGLTSYFHNPFFTTFNGAGTGFDSTAFSTGPTLSMDGSNVETRAVVGDLTGDKKPDIVYRANNGSIALSKNEGIAGVIKFSNPLIFPSRVLTNIIAIHDFDGDGLNDLIAQVPGNDDSSKVFRNTGTSTQPAFEEVQHRHVGKAATIADFDGDGRPDVLTGSFSYNYLQISRNISGAGGIDFEKPYVIADGISFLNLLTAADLNGDGLPELIYRAGGYNFLICRNRSVPGKMAFDAPQTFVACNPVKVLVADFDKDGMPDLALSTGGCISLYIFKNNSLQGGSISLSQPETYSTLTSIDDFGFGDLNGDLKPDIIILNSTNPSGIVLTNSSSAGTISFTSARTVSLPDPSLPFSSFAGLEMADFDGDGRADLLPRLLNTTRFSAIRNIHGSFITGVICPGGSLTLNAKATGSSYQWQESTDSINYSNISNNANFNGATLPQLSIQHIPSSWSGKYIRCLVNGQPDRPVKLRVINYFNGTIDNDWNKPQNWSCGIIPDIHSEVVVTGNVTLNSNATIKALFIQPGANIQVGAGYLLTILQ